MILIVKPKRAPAVLLKGVALIEAMAEALAASPNTAGSATDPFAFSKAVYGCKALKTALKTAQHSKCCYCEGEIGAHFPGDVDHFRPKAYSQQTRSGSRIYPGYYWLAYEWKNLYLSCEVCNRVGKRNVFPIADDGVRATSGAHDLIAEKATILDPADKDEDPRDHIRFEANVPVGRTARGRATIEVLGLDRIELNARRLAQFRRLQTLRDLVAVLSAKELTDEEAALLGEAKAEIGEAQHPSAEYSAMARDLLAAN